MGKGVIMGRKILEIEAVTKKYKEFTLEPVSFSLGAAWESWALTVPERPRF